MRGYGDGVRSLEGGGAAPRTEIQQMATKINRRCCKSFKEASG